MSKIEFNSDGTPKGYKLKLSKEQINKMFNTPEQQEYKRKKIKTEKFRESMYKFTSFGGIQIGLKLLIIINVLVFIFTNIFGASNIMLYPMSSGRFEIWQIFTSMFAHYGVIHIAFNMIALYFIGKALEDLWGTKKFLTFYIISGIGAALISSIFLTGPALGASGAICGLFAAYAILYPEASILMFFFIPMKIKTAAYLFAGISIIFGIFALVSPSSGGVQIDHFAHLGGMATGALISYFWIKRNILQTTGDLI